MISKKMFAFSGTFLLATCVFVFAQQATKRTRVPARSTVGDVVPATAPDQSVQPRLTLEQALDALENTSMFVSEDGKLQIAGVTHLSVNTDGSVVVEAQPNGDFDTDIVVTIRVPMYVDSEGALSASGIESVERTPDGVALTITPERPGFGIVAATPCQTRIEVPSLDVTCVTVSGCSLGLECGWQFVDPTHFACECGSPLAE